MAHPIKGLRRSAATDRSTAATTELSVAPADPARASADPARATSFLERVPLRRRMQYLRRRRELALRELGGFVFEEHQQGEDRVALRTEKLEALDALDRELHTIEQGLAERRELAVLREPGIASCPHCATIHGSEAKFCPNCGVATARQSTP